MPTLSETTDTAENNLPKNATNLFIITEDGPLKGLKNYGDALDWIFSGVKENEDPVELSKIGIDSTLKLLQTDGALITFEGAKELAGAIAPVFKWGQAAYSIVKKFSGGELGAIKTKLKQILEELTNVEHAIRNGFEKLIAHDDAIYYRDKISAPTQILFDSLQRHSSVLDQAVQTKFLDSCKEYPPVDILSRLFDFLKMADNGLMTQLIANKFGYKVYKEWTAMMRADVVRCAVVQMYYDGIMMEHEHTASEDDADYLAGKIKEIEDRFFQIDEDRCFRFIECGEAGKLFRQITTEIAVREQSNYENDDTPEMMKSIHERWLEANGTQAFSFQVFRGRMMVWEYSPRNDGCVRAADYKMYGYENRMVIVDNLYGTNHQNNEDYTFPDAPHKYKNNDNINILLIQPITKEMVENHATAAYDDRNRGNINSILDSYFHKKHVPEINWQCLQNLWPRFYNEGISKPMICLYTNENGSNKDKSICLGLGGNPTVAQSFYTGRLDLHYQSKWDLARRFATLDFTMGRRWEQVDFLDKHYTKMNFSFLFM